jgi:hypothetical protein
MIHIKINRRNLCLYALLAIVVPIGICLLRWGGPRPHRVHREHAETVAKEFEYLTRRFDFHPPWDSWQSRVRAQEDLDELEWLLENRYSYLHLKGVDYKAALDSIRCSLGDGINRSTFGYQLSKFFALFGDGHSCVASSSVRLRSFCSSFPPFLVEESAGRLVAFKPDRSDFFDPNFPFLRAIDGLSMDKWIHVAGLTVAKGSPQFVRYNTLRNLRYVEALREELGLSESETLEVRLESADGLSTRRLVLPLVEERPVYGFWPRPEKEIKLMEEVRVESRILEPNIGYLRFVMMLAEPEFLDDLIEAMGSFSKTDGLIIDIRTNGGGRRSPLRVLFPFFMSENDKPRVVNVAAYRLGTENIKEDFKARFLYQASSWYFSRAEREIVDSFASTFKPEWTPPQEQFGKWHYFVISPSQEDRYYHYTKPVVILMDRWNFSACDIFLGAFKGCKNVTLMGQPSGGGSGCRQEYRLSNSGIRICLSRMASFQPNGKLYDGNGIRPDIVVESVPTDFIGRTDTVLDKAVDTTDCLEAVGVFKGWKNFLFVIVILSLLLLQASFLLVDMGCIEIEQQAVGGEPAVISEVTAPDQGQMEVIEEDVQEAVELVEEPAVEPDEPVEAVESDEVAEPEQAVEPEDTAVPEEVTEPEEEAEPQEGVDPNEEAEPNEPAEDVAKAVGHNLQRAIAWPPTEFLSGITFEYLSWVIRVVNAVLILTATLYCLSMLFSLKVSMLGRLGGINHISRAFFLSLLMLILLLPWQRIFGGMVPGAIYTPEELLEWYSAEAGDMLDKVIYYLRFSGYWLLVFLLLILSQIRSIRWGKAILRRLEII